MVRKQEATTSSLGVSRHCECGGGQSVRKRGGQGGGGGGGCRHLQPHLRLEEAVDGEGPHGRPRMGHQGGSRAAEAARGRLRLVHLAARDSRMQQVGQDTTRG